MNNPQSSGASAVPPQKKSRLKNILALILLTLFAVGNLAISHAADCWSDLPAIALTFAAAAAIVRVVPGKAGKISGTLLGAAILCVIVVHQSCVYSSGMGFVPDNLYHINPKYISEGMTFHGHEIMGSVALYLVDLLTLAVMLSRLNFKFSLRRSILGGAAAGICFGALFYPSSPFAELWTNLVEVRYAWNSLTMSVDDWAKYGVKFTEITRDTVKAEPGKNLLLIFMESAERDIISSELYPDLAPNLKNIRDHESVDFSGMVMEPTSSSTISGIYSALLGALMPFGYVWNSNLGSQWVSVPWILRQAGYSQTVMRGVSSRFIGFDIFIAHEGYDKSISTDEIPSRYVNTGAPRAWLTHTWRDSELFEHAYDEYRRLLAAGKPFNLSLITIDAHDPNGFYNPEEPPYPHECDPKVRNILNAVHASDIALEKFITRIKALPGSENLCIVFVSDHLMRQSSTPNDDLSKLPQRHMSFFVIAPDQTPRQITTPGTTCDAAPTILELLGVKHNYLFPLGESLLGNPDPRRLGGIDTVAKLRGYANDAYAKLRSPAQLPDVAANGIRLADSPYWRLDIGGGFDMPFVAPSLDPEMHICRRPEPGEMFVLIYDADSKFSNGLAFWKYHSFKLAKESLDKFKSGIDPKSMRYIVIGGDGGGFAREMNLPPVADNSLFVAYGDGEDMIMAPVDAELNAIDAAAIRAFEQKKQNAAEK